MFLKMMLYSSLEAEVHDLGPETAVEHLRHVRSEALEEAGGVVHVVAEPLLVRPLPLPLEQVVEVVVLLLVNGLATEGEGLFTPSAWGRASQACAAGASAGWLSALCILSNSRAPASMSLGVLEGTPSSPVLQPGACKSTSWSALWGC
jgi:hypothetical protein